MSKANLSRKLTQEEFDCLWEVYQLKSANNKFAQMAAQVIINSALFIIRSIAYKVSSRTRFEYGELLTEGTFGAYHALEKYNPERGKDFYTYCFWWVRSYVSLYLKNSNSRLPLLHIDQQSSDDNNQFEIPGRELPPDQQLENAEQLNRLNRLDKRSKEVMIMRFQEGKTLEEVGNALGGISKERVRQIEKRALEKLAV